MKGWEILPHKTGLIFGAVAYVWCQHSPSPRLRPPILEPYIHRRKTAQLAEDVLLTSFSGNGLRQQLSNLAGIEMVDETPDTRFAEAGEALVEIEPLADGGVGVIVDALLWGSLAEHVG